jgi:nucleoside-diphosphate-sugar epimerase
LLAAGAHAVQVDLRDRQAAIEACEGMDAVCHAAALSAPWGPRSEFFAANVGGTAVIIDGCRQHKVNRLVYISSPSVVFNGLDQYALTEAAPFPKRFVSVYSLTKKMGEDLVNAASDIPSVILRPKAIFGEGDRALLPPFPQGEYPKLGMVESVDVRRQRSWAVRLALEAPAAVGHTYHITNDEHILWETITMILGTWATIGCAYSLKTAYAAAGLMKWCAPTGLTI